MMKELQNHEIKIFADRYNCHYLRHRTLSMRQTSSGLTSPHCSPAKTNSVRFTVKLIIVHGYREEVIKFTSHLSSTSHTQTITIFINTLTTNFCQL